MSHFHSNYDDYCSCEVCAKQDWSVLPVTECPLHRVDIQTSSCPECEMAAERAAERF